jgi:Xaa-Pro aminopeptidase
MDNINIEQLHNDTLVKRLTRLCNIINNTEFYIQSTMIDNDFMRPVINQYFLYLTVLPSHLIIKDSLLHVSIKNNKCNLTIYYKNDPISGRNYKNIISPIIKLENISEFNKSIPEISSDIKKNICDIMIIKDQWEILQIQDSIDITLKAFDNVKQFISTNNKYKENNIESIFIKTFLDNHFEVAYTPIIASSYNASSIHYIDNNSNITNNNFLLIDCGAKNIFGYCADITRTLTIGNISDKHIAIYNIVKKAHDDTLQYLNENLEKGISIADLNECCVLSFIDSFKNLEHSKEYDLWNNTIDACIKNLDTSRQMITKFYTHSIGHHVGLLVHDLEDLNNYQRKLQEGNVITIEPGLYFNKDYIGDNSVPEIYYEIGGVRIENMIYIGHEYNNEKSKILKGFVMSNYEF